MMKFNFPELREISLYCTGAFFVHIVLSDYAKFLPATSPPQSLFFLCGTGIIGPLPELPPGFGPPPPDPLSSNKSHILKSGACSTTSSAISPVRSIMAQTSSKLRSTRDTPHHSRIFKGKNLHDKNLANYIFELLRSFLGDDFRNVKNISVIEFSPRTFQRQGFDD